jgi:hypothetical protein
MRRGWPYLVALLAVWAAVMVVLVLKDHHHGHHWPSSTTAGHAQPTTRSSRRAGTTPWSASVVSAPSRGPVEVAPAARRFALTYVAFLRRERDGAVLANVGGRLRRALADHQAAAIPGRGATEITGLHVDEPAADGSVGVIVQARVGGSAFGLAITMARQHGRWVAIEIPSAHGSF